MPPVIPVAPTVVSQSGVLYSVDNALHSHSLCVVRTISKDAPVSLCHAGAILTGLSILQPHLRIDPPDLSYLVSFTSSQGRAFSMLY